MLIISGLSIRQISFDITTGYMFFDILQQIICFFVPFNYKFFNKVGIDISQVKI